MQLSLLDLKPIAGTIAERFAAFHGANPHVFELFRRLAEEVRAAGFDRYSADAIIQVVRWRLMVEMKRTDARPFKPNDHYTAMYSRMLMEVDASFEGFFELRKLRANAGETS